MDKLLSGRSILVVEDEMMVLMMIETLLSDLGCGSVSTAATIGQALALIEANAFDAAMLDLNLNGSRSYAVADALEARGVPFLFSTGYGGQGVADPYRAHPVLKKPFKIKDMKAVFQLLPLNDGALPSLTA